MTADLHAIWLDDLAPGEGATPLFDQLFAEVDDETRSLVLRACADEHTEPVAVPEWSLSIDGKDVPLDPPDAPPSLVIVVPTEATTPKPKKKPANKPAAKKVTPRKKPGVLADAEAKLAGVKARVKAQTDELGGAS